MTLIGCFVTPHPPIIVPEVGETRLAEAHPTVQRHAQGAREGRRACSRHHRAPVSARSHGHAIRWGCRWRRRTGVLSPTSGRRTSGWRPRATRRSPRRSLERGAEAGIPAVATASPSRGGRPRPRRVGPAGLPHGRADEAVPAGLALLLLLSCEEHVRFGEAIGGRSIEAPQRVLYVASGDLSHRLIPGAPAGFDPRGAQFDRSGGRVLRRGRLGAAHVHRSRACRPRRGSAAIVRWPCSREWWRPRRAAGAADEESGALVRRSVRGGISWWVRSRSRETSREQGNALVTEAAKSGDDPLVSLARRAIEAYVRDGVVIDPAAGSRPAAAPGRRVRLSSPARRRRSAAASARPSRTSPASRKRSWPTPSAPPPGIPVSTRSKRASCDGLDISVDVLETPEEVSGPEELDVKEYGVIVRTIDGRQALAPARSGGCRHRRAAAAHHLPQGWYRSRERSVPHLPLPGGAASLGGCWRAGLVCRGVILRYDKRYCDHPE